MYINMPRRGFGSIGKIVELTGKYRTASSRARARAEQVTNDEADEIYKTIDSFSERLPTQTTAAA